MATRMTDPCFDILAPLVAADSVSSTDPRFDHSNRRVCELLADWLEDAGFACDLRTVGNDKVNLIARRGKGPGGLVLAGHADTVPCDPDQWRADPWRLRAFDDRWTGLGSTDMKGFLALCVDLARRIQDQPLSQPLTIVATADEESGMAGAKALVSDAISLGNFAVIGEPTGLRPVHMHKGIFFSAVTVHGRAGHSSDPDAGLNAIDGVHAALSELMRFRDELRTRSKNPEFSVPYCTLNPGCIHGGDSPNRIPSRVRLEWDLRYLPGMDGSVLRAELEGRMSRALQQGGWPHEFECAIDSAPFATQVNSPIIVACAELAEQPPEAVNFATEAGYFNQLNAQSVVLGPGHIAQAHQPEEFLPVAHLQRTREILDGLVHRFCQS